MIKVKTVKYVINIYTNHNLYFRDRESQQLKDFPLRFLITLMHKLPCENLRFNGKKREFEIYELIIY